MTKKGKVVTVAERFRQVAKALRIQSRDSLILNLVDLESERKIVKVGKSKQTKLILQRAKERCMCSVACQIYKIANGSRNYDDTVSSNNAKLVKKIKMRIKIHIFHPKNPSLVIQFQKTIKPAFDLNDNHKGAAI